jgi:autotransporter-associated beta strand protein
MKTRSTRIASVTHQIPRVAFATARGIETLQLMKTKLTMLKLLIILCCTVATTAVFGQATVTWDGGASGAATELGNPTNWSGDTLPSTANADTCLWDGTVPGNISLIYASNNLASGYGNPGLFFSFASTQTGTWTLTPPPSGDSGNLAIDSIYITNGAGAVTFGGTVSARKLNIVRRPSGLTRYYENNSASTATITPYVRWQAGGGSTYTHAFYGTGAWQVNNYLADDNSPAHDCNVEVGGRMFWNPSGYLGAQTMGTVSVVYGGTLVLQANHPKLEIGGSYSTSQAFTIDGAFIFNAPGVSQILPGLRPISGGGMLVVSNGTLTLSGANTFYGTNLLGGGELIVNSSEVEGVSGPLGLGSTVSFTGGTLGFSANNTYDYSPRFDTSAGQAYRIDVPAGLSVTFTNALASSGGTLTKVGPGRLTLAGANTYSGTTTVSAGKLVIAGSAGSGSITVANSAVLGVTGGGSQITPATLTVGTSSSATLEFNSVSSTATAPLAVSGGISAGSPITVNINGGSFAVGQSYPLFSWGSGSAPPVSLGLVIGAVGTLSTNGSRIQFNVSALADQWTGGSSGNWDTTTTGNWLLGGSPVVFANGDAALFDDTATGTANVTLNAAVSPAGVTVNNNTNIYSIASSGANLIGGSGGFTKAGNNLCTLSGGVNTYSGPTVILGGMLSVGALTNGGSPSDIGASGNTAASLVLGGGTLQYTGGAVGVDRLFTLGTASGTIDASGSAALSLTNTGSVGLSGTGARTLTLAGTNTDNNTFAAVLGDSGGATALTKSGAGIWILTGNNTFSGVTTISGGTLQVGTGGASGSLGLGDVVNGGTLIFNRSGTLTNAGAVSGGGAVIKNGPGTVILPGNNSYLGGTTISNGTLQVGNGGATGSLYGGGGMVNDGTFVYNSTGMLTLSGNGAITGTGNVSVQAGFLKAVATGNSWTGWTFINSGAMLQPTLDNAGATNTLNCSVVTNNGVLRFEGYTVRDPCHANIVGSGRVEMGANNANPGTVVLAGTNTYTGGTYIGDARLQFGDGSTAGGGSFVGDVIFCNNWSTPDDLERRLIFNCPDDRIISGNIVTNFTSPQNNRGIVQLDGYGTVTLTGNNTYASGTVINAGKLQVGNGGTSGNLGYGSVTINSGELVFNRSDDVTVSAVIDGPGNVVKMGAGKLTLAAATNTYYGSTVVSNGTLVINGENVASSTVVYGGRLGGTGTLSGLVMLEAGTTLAPGDSIGTLTINNSLYISGNVAIEVNKSLAQSNDVVVAVLGVQNNGTGTLTVANLGPALQKGDKFTLFSQPVGNGGALTVTGGGATWTNNLAVDGSISVATVIGPPTLNYTQVGSSLQFSWTGGYKLQAQTNSLSVGLSTNWADYPGGGTSPVTVPMAVANGTVFFRLVSTP